MTLSVDNDFALPPTFFWRLPEFRRSPAFFRTALRVTAENWQGVPLTVALPSGHALRIEGHAPGAEVRLEVKDFNFIRRILASGDVGFAEGYAAGDWDTPDLPALLIAFSHNFDRLGELMTGNPVVRALDFFRHALKRNSRTGSRKNIHAHYDLGNGFYAGWLDPSMTYSAALFEHAQMTLEEAQGAKYAALARSMKIEASHKVLEIGCGWGGFAEYVGREIGAEVEAVTISQAQHDYAAKRIFEAGLADRVKIRLCDYRDVSGRFDRIGSIEMFEAVGEAYWPTFFGKVEGLLAPGGVAGLQIITIADELFEGYRSRPDFIQKYIFPGGMLPSDRRLREETAKAGLAWVDCRGFASDYARTLSDWGERFEAAWPAVRDLGFDERFRRLWRYYLGYCEAGFRTGRTDVVHLTLAKA
jgi:cyclopropane-fatty-acyl-phospholipid synthase